MRSSSIFSSELLQRYWRRPGRDHRWHALLVVAGAIVLFGGSTFLDRNLGPAALRTPDARILFVGTSHVTRGIDVGSLDVNAIKLDLAGLDLAVSDQAVEKHLAEWPDLELALIEVDEFSLFCDTVRGYERNLSELCGKLSLNAWELPSHPSEPLRNYVAISSLWSGRGYSALWERKRLTIGNVAMAQSTPAKKRTPPSADGARARVSYAKNNPFATSPRANCEQYNLPALLRLIETLRKNGVQVRLVRYPVSQVYRAARPPEWQTWIDAAVLGVHTEFPDVELWDYSSDDRFTDADFNDVDHLTAAGARRLTRILQTRCSTLFGQHLHSAPGKTKPDEVRW